MKALTLYQPWAQLVALGHKKIETRSWRTSHRGLLAIHAAKTQLGGVAEALANEERAAGRLPERMPMSAIVAVVNLVSIEPTENALLTVSELERRFGDYSDGRFSWFLDNVRPLTEPVWCRGARGLWDVPEDIEWTIANALQRQAEERTT